MRKQKSVAYGFVDASNIIYGAKDSNWFIDQKKLFDYLKSKYHIKKVFFYFGLEDKNLKQVKFLKKLKQFGFTVRAKKVKRYGKRRKANCDVDLTLDSLLESIHYTHGVFLTGDGDFYPLLVHLKKQKKIITVIAWPKRTARELRELVGSKFVDMNNLRYLLERKPKKKGKTLK